jgi:hypothetical protein
VSESIPGSTRNELARELVRVSSSLPADAHIVEIGTLFGAATVLLAGPRKSAGSGKVHAVDPFDCSGDLRSTPIYERLLRAAGGGSLREQFEENMRHAGVSEWIEVHQGQAIEVAANWTLPVDMIYVDLDVSGEAAGEALQGWERFLKPGGIIVVHNSDPDEPPAGNIPIQQGICSPAYVEIRVVDGNTFARRSVI